MTSRLLCLYHRAEFNWNLELTDAWMQQQQQQQHPSGSYSATMAGKQPSCLDMGEATWGQPKFWGRTPIFPPLETPLLITSLLCHVIHVHSIYANCEQSRFTERVLLINFCTENGKQSTDCESFCCQKSF